VAISTSTPMTTWVQAQASPSRLQPRHSRPVRRGMLANEFIRLPIHMVDRMPANAPRWGLGHKQAMRQWHKRSIVIMGPRNRFHRERAGYARSHRDRQVGTAGGAHLGNVHPVTFEIGEIQASARKRGSRRPEQSVRR